MFDCADAGHKEDYPLREGEGEKCAAGLAAEILFRDRYDKAERVQPIGGKAVAEDAVCENGAQKAAADKDGGAKRRGFLGPTDVIVKFWGHLDGVLVPGCAWKLVMGLEMQDRIYIYIYVGWSSWCLKFGRRGCTRQQRMFTNLQLRPCFTIGGVSMGRDC